MYLSTSVISLTLGIREIPDSIVPHGGFDAGFDFGFETYTTAAFLLANMLAGKSTEPIGGDSGNENQN